MASWWDPNRIVRFLNRQWYFVSLSSDCVLYGRGLIAFTLSGHSYREGTVAEGLVWCCIVRPSHDGKMVALEVRCLPAVAIQSGRLSAIRDAVVAQDAEFSRAGGDVSRKVIPDSPEAERVFGGEGKSRHACILHFDNPRGLLRSLKSISHSAVVSIFTEAIHRQVTVRREIAELIGPTGASVVDR